MPINPRSRGRILPPALNPLRRRPDLLREDVRPTSNPNNVKRRDYMIRKTLIALAAVATVAGSVAVPTAASAMGWHHHHYHGFGWRGFGIRVVTTDYSCIRWVRVGYHTYKRVNIC